jgi:hypothetical protein
MEVEQRIGVWIDQEILSSLSYPDVLVSAVYELMSGIKKSLERRLQPAPPPTLLNRIRRRRPALTAEERLISELSNTIDELQMLKFAPIDRKIEWTITNEDGIKDSVSGGVKIKLVTLDASSQRDIKASTAAKETIEGTKEQYLERALSGFRDLVTQAAQVADGGFVFVDDLYQLRRADQPLVLGYFHRLIKDTALWLKIGSIRYSTITFKPGDPPRGMQVGHDAHEVALDRGLRYLQSTQQFLETILSAIAARVKVDIKSLLTEDARKRLVLAAGGVARDYLRLVAGAIMEARNRGVTNKPGSHRVIVEDVNKAAGLLSPTKLEDLRKDEPAEAALLEGLVRRLTEFCRSCRTAYFLVATDEEELNIQVNKLQHLRFTHLLHESETIPDRGSQRFNVWLLDVAELSAQRATTGMDFLGWSQREKRRNRRLIYTEQGKQDDSGSKPV